MTDTTTVDGPDAPGTGPDVAADEPIALSAQLGTAEHEPIKDRLLLPLLVPVLSAIAVGTLAVNVSRVFLAGSSEAALFVAVVLVLSILGGASLLAAAPRMRTSSLAVITGLIVVLIMSGGLLTLGPSLGHGEGEPACVAPTGDAANTVSVVAGPGTSFNGVKFSGDYAAAPGVVAIDYSGEVGHTLAFREPDVLCEELQSTGSPTSGKVLLKAGTSYSIFCTIPGHAAQGMEATITVGAS